MNEIYWITRLDSIHCLFIILELLLAFIVGLSLLMMFVNSDKGYESEEEAFNLAQKVLKISGSMLAIVGLLVIFMPTKQDIYAIYGIGGTIDYIKENEKVQELPDKVVEYIDLYIECCKEELEDGSKKEE